MSIFDRLSVQCVLHSSLCINIIQNDNTDHYNHNYYKTKTGNGKFGQKGAFLGPKVNQKHLKLYITSIVLQKLL